MRDPVRRHSRTAALMAAVGDLVKSTAGGWIVRPPTHCPAGHQLAPGRVVVGHQPCSCRGGHTTWTCWCGNSIYGPPVSEVCRLLSGAAAVR